MKHSQEGSGWSKNWKYEGFPALSFTGLNLKDWVASLDSVMLGEPSLSSSKKKLAETINGMEKFQEQIDFIYILNREFWNFQSYNTELTRQEIIQVVKTEIWN